MPEWSVAEAPAEDVIVFAVGTDRFGLSISDVEAISPPPPLRQIPHAGPALLGAGNLSGQIVPILDLAQLLGERVRADRTYDGRGEIIRIRNRQGGIGFWVDKVERLAPGAIAESGELEILDPTALLKDALTPPSLAAASPSAPDGADTALLAAGANNTSGGPANPAGRDEQAWVLVDIAGDELALRRSNIAELLEDVRWTRIPRSPPGLLGVAVLRGNALPLLSLGNASAAPASFARIHCEGAQALLALDCIIGLREGDPGDARVIELETVIPQALRTIAQAFVPFAEASAETAALPQDGTHQYLSFTLGGQQFALPVVCVERVVEAPPLIPLPRLPDRQEALDRTAGAIEIRGQIIPVAATRARLGLRNEPPDHSPSAYAVVRSEDGLGAVEIDKIGALVALAAGQVMPPPPDTELLSGVATISGNEPLRIIAPERLWEAS